nr:hypothetical protein [Nocardioides alcanivorans]
MFEQYRSDPSKLSPEWRAYFADNKGGVGQNSTADAPAAPKKAAPEPAVKAAPAAPATSSGTPAPVARPRPASKAAEPAKGTSSPSPGTRRSPSRPPLPTSPPSPCCAAPRPVRRPTWRHR